MVGVGAMKPSDRTKIPRTDQPIAKDHPSPHTLPSDQLQPTQAIFKIVPKLDSLSPGWLFLCRV